MSEKKQSHKRTIQGRVVSNAGDKSAVVLVERKVVHPKYRKIVKRFKKYTVHDEENTAKVGDVVLAVECKPISKTKSFMLSNIILAGVQL